ncbi:beta-ketoacyl-[acyl-carrier-protein] synthase family protein [Mucilaginibacter myungsuensis]|uniref:Beta-ketoacyl synthase-like protein n=1 Tax=Mucilaginibacter myungsuensis TaxID=649104 RepID=A0A929KYQ7_9SPHI|nr:hypothetical protein [Mucilaginibacter myungsuensis]MBE9661334.1 hypothetical protein [Mucilaginibacter myungsuensis]MDN3597477.1 hypothetical protein [Mucilaginibacter myungsuensis]
MSAPKYITSACIISNDTVTLNGEQSFAGDNSGVDSFLLSVYQHFQLSYPKFHKMDRLSKLGWLAAELLLQNFDSAYYQPEQVGTVLANANSSLDMDLKYYDSISDVPSPSLFVYTLPNIVAGEICIRHHFKGENAFFVQPKFDAEFIQGQVDQLLDQNILQACICGWVDVLGQAYEAKLYLVEKIKKDNAVEFAADQMK